MLVQLVKYSPTCRHNFNVNADALYKYYSTDDKLTYNIKRCATETSLHKKPNDMEGNNHRSSYVIQQ